MQRNRTEKHEGRIDKVMAMYEGGLSFGSIADQLGQSRSAISGIVHRNRKTPANPVKAAATVGVSTRKVSDGVHVFGGAAAAAKFHNISKAAARQRALNGIRGWFFVDGDGE